MAPKTSCQEKAQSVSPSFVPVRIYFNQQAEKYSNCLNTAGKRFGHSGYTNVKRRTAHTQEN